MAENSEVEPSREELLAVYKEVMERRKSEQQNTSSATSELPRSSSEGRLQDQSGKYIDYDTAKDLWNAKRGLNPNMNTPEPLTDEQKTQDAQYRKLRAEWYSRQGRIDPKQKNEDWENRLKKDQARVASQHHSR